MMSQISPEISQPFSYAQWKEDNNMVAFTPFPATAETTLYNVYEGTYISSKKKRPGISGKKTRYFLKYRPVIAK